MITQDQANEIAAREKQLQAWIDTIRSKNGWASYKPEDKPANIPDVTNDERSSLEVFNFVTNPPDRYFLYINEERFIATTFTGEKLGSVSFGREYQSPGFYRGSKRVPVTIKGINGRTYYGTYFKSAGNYARVKMSKFVESWDVQQRTAQGWETVTSETTYKEARDRQREYRENQPEFTVRIKLVKEVA